MLVVLTLAMSMIMAIGETAEEARFMISLLPMLMCMPGWPLHIGKWLKTNP
jgi:hypothetical protein